MSSLATPYRTLYEAFVAAKARFLGDNQHDAAPTVFADVRHPHLGPDRLPLSTSVVSIPGDPALGAIVVICGTHGVEGIAGGRVMANILMRAEFLSMHKGPWVFVFQLNPWGAAHLRRTDELGIDLNRNAGNRKPAADVNEAYNGIARTLIPDYPNEVVPETFAAPMKNMGRAEFQRVVTSGQTADPSGLFYMGTQESWSVRTLRWIAKTFLCDVPSVAVVDLHTGLGDRGVGYLFAPEADPFARTLALARAWYNDSAADPRTHVQAPNAGESLVSAPVMGDILTFLQGELRGAIVVAVALEMGIKPLPEALLALCREAWATRANQDGCLDDRALAQARKDLLAVFNDYDPAWQDAFLGRTNAVLKQASAGLCAWTAHN